MTDFRALCEELVEELEVWIGYGDEADCADAHAVVDRARAALAEQPVVPTDEELLQIFDTVCLSEGGTVDEIHLRGLRAVLARWGQPATPIPVAERLPGPEDCDADGRCWLLFRSASMEMTPVWSLVQSRSIFDGPYTHWIPANALPVPSNV
jgi:hypothetical protein